MSSRTVDKQLAGERGELYVFGELLKRGMVSYVPLVKEGVDALVRTATGAVIEIQVQATGSAGGKYPRWFQMGHLEPRKNFMIIGVEFEEGDPKCAWIFPSIVFDKFATNPANGTPRDLNLEVGVKKIRNAYEVSALRISRPLGVDRRFRKVRRADAITR